MIEIADVVTENIIRFFPQVRKLLPVCVAAGNLYWGNNGEPACIAMTIKFMIQHFRDEISHPI